MAISGILEKTGAALEYLIWESSDLQWESGPLAGHQPVTISLHVSQCPGQDDKMGFWGQLSKAQSHGFKGQRIQLGIFMVSLNCNLFWRKVVEGRKNMRVPAPREGHC